RLRPQEAGGRHVRSLERDDGGTNYPNAPGVCRCDQRLVSGDELARGDSRGLAAVAEIPSLSQMSLVPSRKMTVRTPGWPRASRWNRVTPFSLRLLMGVAVGEVAADVARALADTS